MASRWRIWLELTGTLSSRGGGDAARVLAPRGGGAPAQVVFQQTGLLPQGPAASVKRWSSSTSSRRCIPRRRCTISRSPTALAQPRAGADRAGRGRAPWSWSRDRGQPTACAWVLDHDLLRRWLHRGFDLAGSEAELRHAKALDAKDFAARRSLGIVLEHDRDAVRYGAHSRIADALAEFRAIARDLGNHETDEYALYDLMHLGRWKGSRTRRTRAGGHTRNAAGGGDVADSVPAALAR